MGVKTGWDRSVAARQLVHRGPDQAADFRIGPAGHELPIQGPRSLHGVEGRLARSSTDSNVPIALGVPAVTIGRGGVGQNGHAPDEYWVNRDAFLAVQRALLLVVAEAGFAGPISQ